VVRAEKAVHGSAKDSTEDWSYPKSQSWAIAQSPTNKATPVLRAGLTDVFVTDADQVDQCETEAMAMGANPCAPVCRLRPV